MSRHKRKSVKPLLLACLLIAGVIILAFIPTEGPGPSETTAARPDATETPAEAVTDYASLEKVEIPPHTSNRMIDYEGFTVAFNRRKHQPNYVVWTLTPEKTDGPYSRKDSKFMRDDSIRGCATLYDYRNSGFDRGHMAPAADMKWSKKAMDDCHLLTNMCPQDKRLNTGAWATVENNSRKWAVKHGPLIIIAGPVLTDRITRTIGNSKIPVPERFFKVILAPEANPPMGIGFIMPNSYVEGGAQSTVVSIDEVEAVTGFDFFAALPDDIEQEVESQKTLRKWNK